MALLSSPGWIAPPELRRAIPFVLPLALYLIVGFWEPTFPAGAALANVSRDGASVGQRSSPRTDQQLEKVRRYLAINLIRLMVVGGSAFFFWRVFTQNFALKISWHAFVVGLIGAAIWVGLCELGLERRVIAAVGGDITWLGQRSQFNPFLQIDSGLVRALFFATRFGILVFVVPIAEELFLRGFLMRVIHSEQWFQVDLKDLGWVALLCGSAYGVITHPAEAFAAAVWFSLLSWLMLRTGKFWNCVLAHGLTNGLLGCYIICFGRWQYW